MKVHLSKFGGLFTEKEYTITNDGLGIELTSDYQITSDTKVNVLCKNGENVVKFVAKGNMFKVPDAILLEGELYLYITLYLDKDVQKFNCEPLRLISLENTFQAIPVVQELTEQVYMLVDKVGELTKKVAEQEKEIQRLWETTEE